MKFSSWFFTSCGVLFGATVEILGSSHVGVHFANYRFFVVWLKKCSNLGEKSYE